MLAITRAGGAYLPLDPASPAERLTFQLDDAKVAAVLTQRWLRSLIDAPELRVHVFDGQRLDDQDLASQELDGQALSKTEAASGLPASQPSQLAYVIYTSGSTGRPKGSELAHRGLSNLVDWHLGRYALDTEDRTSWLAGPGFDASVWEFWPPLCSGASLTIPPASAPSDPERLASWTASHGVTQAFMPTPVAEAVLPILASRVGRTPLRALLTGGDRLHQPPVAELDFELVNHYGPTESTVVTTHARVELASAASAAAAPPIGRPISNLRAFVVDGGLHPLPIGAPGELTIAGIGLTRGYLGRPKQTAERLLPDPFSPVPGKRLYATGDRVRTLADGSLDFLDRLDRQIQIRGLRVELGEIEAALCAAPGVREAVVIQQESEAHQGSRLVAFVVAVPDGQAGRSVEALCRQLPETLRQRLPEHMVPAICVPLDALPLTPNGKVDRRVLPLPAWSEASDYLPPRSELERRLAEIWSELLGVERIGIADDFFTLGGHSLLAARLTWQLRETLGVDVAVRQLFDTPTVEGLAAALAPALETAASTGTEPTLPPLIASPRHEPVPLALAQERLWFLAQWEPESSAYHISGALELDGPLDVAALRASLDNLIRRHEPLRTGFRELDGRPIQQIAPSSEADLPSVDLSRLTPEVRAAQSQQLLARFVARPFDLRQPPLARAVLLELDDAQHVFGLVLHHLIADGASVGVLLRELAEIYAAVQDDEPLELPAHQIQYADFAIWQRRYLEAQHQALGSDKDAPLLDHQLAYWRSQLAGLEVLELAGDRPAAARSTGSTPEASDAPPATLLPIELSAPLADAIRGLARERGVTRFMLLQAAFHALLSRLTGRRDVAVGSVLANRPRQELEHLVGFFVNTLVLRADLSGNPDFDELLRRTRRTTVDATAHQDVPYDRVVAEVIGDAEPTAEAAVDSRLFTLMLVLQAPWAAPRLPGLESRRLDVAGRAAKFDLTLILEDLSPQDISLEDLSSESQDVAGTPMIGELEADPRRFDVSSLRRFLGHFETLLRDAVEDPSRRLDELSILTAAERRQLTAWSTAGDTPPAAIEPGASKAIFELFRERAARAPEAIALVDRGTHVTAGRLADRAARLAHRLRQLGVGPETVVGTLLQPGEELATTVLAILQAGGVYLPLDGKLPAERLALMLEDSAARLVVTDSRLAEGLLEATPRLLLDRETLPEASRAPSWGPPPADSTAYVIYTSGSTGRPKGVPISHANLLPTLIWGRDRFALGPETRVLQSLAHIFDFGVFELLTSLVFGATLHVLEGDELADPELAARYAAAVGIDTLHATPSFARQLLNAEPDDSGASALKTLHLGGEALSRQMIDALFERLPNGCVIYNGYGPTEATINSTIFCVGSADRRHDGQRNATPIGRRSAHHRLGVLDGRGRRLPIATPGELAVGGNGLSRGYLRRPALTAERFVPDPLAEAAGARRYLTGDVVRWLPDGHLEFSGRVDDQVKIRGFRIELGEIEAALLRHPSVAEAVVVTRSLASERSAAGSQTLVGYLVSVPGHELDPQAVKAHLRAHLPDAMVPAILVPLEQIPLLPTGKVDRSALPEPAPKTHDPRDAEPRSPLEEMLAGLWADVLDRERVGRHDDFFELGGHSLLATRLVSRIRKACRVELPLRQLFATPSVAQLAEFLENTGSSQAAPPLVSQPRDAAGPQAFPLSFAQERLWLLTRLGVDPALYAIPSAVRLRGRLDATRLEGALAAVVTRHESLRTTFEERDGEPVQVIHPHSDYSYGACQLPRVDLRALSRNQRHAVADAVRRARQQPFDLERGPLLRATLVRLDDEEHLLLLDLHHIISDGWSTEILQRELAASYASDEDEMPLAPLPVQYADFAHWQRQWLAGNTLERQLDYWRRRLADLPPLELPSDRPQPMTPSSRGGLVTRRLPSELARAVEALGRRAGTTLFMTALAALDAVLARTSGQSDLAVGTAIANRTRQEVEGLIGFFVNTLVLRMDCAGNPSFHELLERSREVALSAYAHQDLPFQTLVARLAPRRDLDATPFFRVMLTLAETAADAPHPSADEPLHLEPLPSTVETAKFDLGLTIQRDTVQHEAEGLTLVWGYRQDLFDRTTVQRLADHLTAVLASSVAEPNRLLAELPLLTRAQHQQALIEWNAQPVRPSEPRLHWLVSDQVERTPDRTAFCLGDAWCTFADLQARSLQLADRLRALDVGPEAIVGVCLQRSPELLISLLAVLEAGGAYLPLDPEHPVERLAFMIEDSQARVLLTDRAWRERLPSVEMPTLCVDALEDSAPAVGRAAPYPEASPEHSAYVMYTSGSTGRPKGVVVPHRAIGHRLSWMARRELDSRSRLLHKTHLHFDASVAELFAPLIAGARIVAMPPGSERESSHLTRWIEERGVTHTSFPTALLDAAVDDPDFARCHSLQHVLVGGERMPEDLPRRFHAGLPGGALLENRYGPTEATISVTGWRCDAHASPSAETAGILPSTLPNTLPIGRPIAGAEVVLLDRWGQPVASPAQGELAIGGPTLARGYLGRPARTAASFVPHAFAERPGQRLYRTGDLARWRADGALEFRGRIDAQVKIRGFRVELGEIETALCRHPAVQQAAVVDHADGSSRRLAAYVVLAEESLAFAEREPADALAAFLSESLPDHMVPAAFVVLDNLPLLVVGKVNRRALPAPVWQAKARFVAPRTALETWLAQQWSELLDVEPVGIRDDFFALGGHSLLATRLVARLRATRGVELELRQVFEHSTIETLAEAIEETNHEDSAGLPLVPHSGPAVPSFSQERLWFLDQLTAEPESTGKHRAEGGPGEAYHLPITLRLTGRLDVTRLEAALLGVARRHDSLRMGFVGVEGRPKPTVLDTHSPELSASFAQIDLWALPAAARPGALMRLLDQHLAQPFELARPPLWRALLVRLDDHEHVLQVVMHHIISDGWSLGVLIRELTELYRAGCAGRAAQLPPLPVGFADFAAWQRQLLDDAQLDR
ncbi:MAG: amino acid adenylation domain-containing protein, partial [Acidobacteriota bacterium]